MTREARYDAALSEYETKVRAGEMTLAGALARAFILGCNYQVEVDAETKANEEEGARIQAREENA